MNLKANGGWSRQQTLKLINELKQRAVLYKVTHPDYLKIYKKQEALEEIAVNLQNIKPHVTAADVKKKIKILQQQMSQEKKKMRAAIRSGMSADDNYVSKLWCFNDLHFLLDANDEIRGQSNLEYNTLDDTLSESECSVSSKKVKRSRLDEAAALRQSANKSMELVTSLIKRRSAQEESKEETFCKMLCSELKELQLTETYENVTTEMLLMVRRAKAAERKRLSYQVSREATMLSDPCSSSRSSLQSSSFHSSVSSLDTYLDDTLQNTSLVLETAGVECLDNMTFVEEGEDCIQYIEDYSNNVNERSEIQSVEVIKTDILQQAFQSIGEESD